MRKKFKIWCITLVAIAIVVAVVLIAQVNNTPDELNIGFVGPLSGGPALWGQASLNMIQIAVDEINADGGVDGKQINLIALDGKCSPKDAVSATRQLIDIHNVDFILGGHCSPETVAMVPVIGEANVFLLAGVTSSDEAVSASDLAFRTSPGTLEQAQVISDLASNKYGFKTIATITEQAAYAKSFTQDIKATFDGPVLEELDYSPGESDFRSGLLKIKSENPDAIWVSPQDPNEAVLILKQMEELDMLDIPLFGNTIFVSSNVESNSDGLLPDSAFTVTLFADPNDPESVELQSKYRARFGTEVPYNLYYISAAYDATYMLRDAIEESGENPTEVAEYFSNIKGYKGAAGTFTFRANGDPVFDSWKEMSVINGKVNLS